MALQLIQRLGTVRGDDHVAAEFTQHALGHQLVDRVVLDQQHPRPSLRDERIDPGIVGRVGLRLQDSPQGLVQRIACQGACLLLQGR
ncbi:hypothetical protein D3C80_1735980 [compost metagenome]